MLVKFCQFACQATAEQISNDPKNQEHYVVDVLNSEIIVYTMKFSTYAIFGNDLTLGSSNESDDMDVQAKITDSSIGVYKVDISWGAMAFEWDDSATVYNPDTHEYESNSSGSWTAESHDGVNNRITCANHSNASLIVSFDVAGTLAGAVYNMFTTNEETGADATDIPLSKVQAENDVAPKTESFLRLSGVPTNIGDLQNTVWTNIGVITVTLEPDMTDLGKTPRI